VPLNKCDRRFKQPDGSTRAERHRELGVAIADQKAGLDLTILQLPGQLPRLLDDPGSTGCGRAASQVDATAADLQEEEHVQALEPDCLDSEEVDRQDLVGMLTDELAPGALASAWRRQEIVTAQNVPDRAVGAAAAQLQEFALNASVSPPRVLPGEPQDQLLALSALARSAPPWSTSIQRPLAAHELAVPVEQSLRADQEGGPSGPWEDLAQGGEEQTVTGLEARPADLAFQDAELMAEGENLDLKIGLGPLALDQELEEEADDAVQEGQKHGWDHGEQGRPAAAPYRCPSRTLSIPITANQLF